jgi:integrase
VTRFEEGPDVVAPAGLVEVDRQKSEDVERLKCALRTRAAKTANSVLAVLSVLLKKAVEWEVIDRMPCSRLQLLPVPKGSAAFYDFDQYERLIEVARAQDARTHLIVLLGGEAGLRVGEMMALEWGDVDLVNRQLCIARSDWNGFVTSPKGGRLRRVPLTRRLAAALSAHRHLRVRGCSVKTMAIRSPGRSCRPR